MSLIECPMCQKEISDKEEICPNCGYPIASEIKNIQLLENTEDNASEELKTVVGYNIVSVLCKVSSIIIGIIVFILGIYFLYKGYRVIPPYYVIYIWGTGYLFCLFLYAIGELIKKATETSDFLKMIYRHIIEK